VSIYSGDEDAGDEITSGLSSEDRDLIKIQGCICKSDKQCNYHATALAHIRKPQPEKCPLKAKLWWNKEHKKWGAEPILVPCVLPHGHRGPCSAEPKALGACAETRKAYEELSPCPICRRVHADWRTAHACE